MRIEGWQQVVEECDGLIRSGKFDLARKKLAFVSGQSIPRSFRLPFANLARRCGLESLGLRLLSPIAHPEREGARMKPTAAETAEYGVLLQKSGAIQDAIRILEKVSVKDVHEALLFRAFCHFSLWEHQRAESLLREYLKIESREYRSLVGTVNLASALIVTGGLREAEALIQEVLSKTHGGLNARLRGNAHELHAQILFIEKNYSGALAELNLASKCIPSDGVADFLLVKKWKAIVQSFQANETESLMAFRADARARSYWEGVRESDRYLLRLEFSQATFERLYFGSPHRLLREKIRSESPARSLPGEFLLGREGVPVLDLRTGALSDGTVIPRTIQNVVTALTRDFYRPITTGGMFSAMFPGEYFDIFSSVNRIHQSVFRVRKWFDENGIGVDVKESGGRYSLDLNDALAILLPGEREAIPRDTENMRLNQIARAVGDRTFKSREVCQLLDISHSSFKTLMAQAIESGRVIRIGAGRATTYRFNLSAPRAA